jgi:dUTP pyrophosphatase
MKIKIKKTIKHAKLPTYAHPQDAGADLYAADNGIFSNDFDFIEFDTGIALEIPEGHMGLVFPRSSISKTPHALCNAVGVIDETYRGSVKLRFRTNQEKEYLEYKFGDKIGQLIILPVPKLEFQEVSELSETERGVGGFGSTDELTVDEFVDEISFEDDI